MLYCVIDLHTKELLGRFETEDHAFYYLVKCWKNGRGNADIVLMTKEQYNTLILHKKMINNWED